MTDAAIVESAPEVAQIQMEDPWRWLAKGFADIKATPVFSLGYGVVFAGISAALAMLLIDLNAFFLFLPLACGFTLLGPMLAVGLYEISRRRQTGEPMQLSSIVVVKTAAPAQIALVGVILVVFFLAWIRVATLLVPLFLGGPSLPPLTEVMATLFSTVEGLSLLVVGSLIGFVLSLLAFAISAISIPILVDHKIDAVTAVITSVKAVKENPGPMLLWGYLIAMSVAIGIGTLFIGMIILFPLIGHATWHASRSAIGEASK